MRAVEMEATLIVDAKSTLGEGPCWDERSNQLYWIDIAGRRIHRYSPEDGAAEAFDLGVMPGAVVPTRGEEWLVAAEDGYYFWTPGTNVLTSIHALDGMRASQRFNDGKCDPLGRFWAGTMEREGGAPTGALYCLDAAGRSRRIVEGLGCSNGMAWSADGRTMYFIDSPTREVRAYDFALESGEISNPRAVVRIPDGEGVPDGMTIDEEGMLWVAQWGGYQVSRWDPSTGERIGSVRVPAERVTSCAFGGPNLDTLYITTASIGASQEQAIAEPTAGGLFAAKPGMRGFAAVPAALAGK